MSISKRAGALVRGAKHALLLSLDSTAFAFALLLSAALALPHAAAAGLLANPAAVFASAIGAMFVFYFAGLSRRFWRFVSIVDLAVIMAAAAASVALAFGVIRLAVPGAIPALSFYLVAWSLAVIFMGCMRAARRFGPMARKLAGRGPLADPALPPALIAGDPASVDLVLRRLEAGLSGGFRPVGILDEIDIDLRRTMRDVPILGGLHSLNRVMNDLAAKGVAPSLVVIAAPQEAAADPRYVSLASAGANLGLKVVRASLAGAVNDERLSLKEFDGSELLGRPAMKFDLDLLARAIRGRRILITGAGGSIGGELSRQVAAFGPASIIMIEACEYNLYRIDLELRENFPGVEIAPLLRDICDRKAIMQAFAAHKPHLVFHAAALKHVPLVEQNPLSGVATNVLGTRNVADAARKHGALAMAQVSTDKAVNPVGVMGATKRLGELYCQALDIDGAGDPAASRFLTVRFGNVVESSGSVVPLFRRQLRERMPLTVTHPNMTRYFMTVHEAVSLVLQSTQAALENGSRRGRIFVLDMGEPIRIVDIANRMIRLSGLVPGIDARIEFIGSRPGEKLSEELFDSAEERLPSVIAGVFEAEPAPIAFATLDQMFASLQGAIARGDEKSLRRDMFALLEARSGGREAPAPEPPAPVSAHVAAEPDHGARIARVSDGYEIEARP